MGTFLTPSSKWMHFNFLRPPRTTPQQKKLGYLVYGLGPPTIAVHGPQAKPFMEMHSFPQSAALILWYIACSLQRLFKSRNH